MILILSISLHLLSKTRPTPVGSMRDSVFMVGLLTQYQDRYTYGLNKQKNYSTPSNPIIKIGIKLQNSRRKLFFPFETIIMKKFTRTIDYYLKGRIKEEF
jgi:hypothetical protein